MPEIPKNIRLYDTLFCSMCRARLPRGLKICHRSAQFLLGAATDYKDEIKQLIWQMKYRNRFALSEPLAKLLNDYLITLDIDLTSFSVIPVPLSNKRLASRGYNQSALIAKIISERFKLPMIDGALVRQKDSAPQAEQKGWDERALNIEGCFGISRPEFIADKNIILVDDVFTSGATLREAAHQLKDFGAKKILGLVIAKAG